MTEPEPVTDAQKQEVLKALKEAGVQHVECFQDHLERLYRKRYRVKRDFEEATRVGLERSGIAEALIDAIMAARDRASMPKVYNNITVYHPTPTPDGKKYKYRGTVYKDFTHDDLCKRLARYNGQVVQVESQPEKVMRPSDGAEVDFIEDLEFQDGAQFAVVVDESEMDKLRILVQKISENVKEMLGDEYVEYDEGSGTEFGKQVLAEWKDDSARQQPVEMRDANGGGTTTTQAVRAGRGACCLINKSSAMPPCAPSRLPMPLVRRIALQRPAMCPVGRRL